MSLVGVAEEGVEQGLEIGVVTGGGDAPHGPIDQAGVGAVIDGQAVLVLHLEIPGDLGVADRLRQEV